VLKKRFEIPVQLKMTLMFISMLVMVYTLIRLGFFVANYSEFSNTSTGEILLAFLTGIRFDLSAIFYSNLIVLILFNLPGYLLRYKWYETIVIFLFLFINSVMLTLSIADYGYFKETERRMSYEVYVMIGDVIKILPSLMLNHFVLLIALILLFFLFYKLFSSFYKKLKTYNFSRINISGGIIGFVILLGLIVLSARGGFQLRPIRPANAFTTNSYVLGYLILNTPFNVLTSLDQDELKPMKFMTEDESRNLTREIIKSDNEQFVNDSYTFQRIRNTKSEPKKMNVVIFIMESWSAIYCGSITGQKTYTPFFDSLASHSLLFTNFFANGQRSIESVPSILVSIPSLSEKIIIGSKSEMNKFRGLGSVLSEQGYSTSFHHGARTGSMGFDGFTRLAGIDKYYGSEDCKGLTDDDYDGMWGVCDEPFFLESVNNISTFKQPFCSIIFTLSSHDPHRIPDKRKAMFDIYKDETDFEKTIRYSDFSIREFFNATKQKDWFNNTIFLITADHTLYNTRSDFYTTFQIPLLIYSPEFTDSKKDATLGSQIDMFPSLLDLLDITTVHSSMGRSLFRTNGINYTILKRGLEYLILSDKYCLMMYQDNRFGLYDFKNDKALENDISSKYPEVTESMKKFLLSYLQSATTAIAENKIYLNNK
jgi:phosphoglycerol transferase MdoB-like AlkP superfamily enzyme